MSFSLSVVLLFSSVSVSLRSGPVLPATHSSSTLLALIAVYVFDVLVLFSAH